MDAVRPDQLRKGQAGYTMPEIDLVNSTAAMPSELQQTRKQFERASKRGRGGGREPQADQWMAAAAAPADGASGAAFWGGATARPRRILAWPFSSRTRKRRCDGLTRDPCSLCALRCGNL